MDMVFNETNLNRLYKICKDIEESKAENKPHRLLRVRYSEAVIQSLPEMLNPASEESLWRISSK